MKRPHNGQIPACEVNKLKEDLHQEQYYFCIHLDGPIPGGLIDRGRGLITGILRYVKPSKPAGTDLFFFCTFRLVVKQRTPSFIILSKESSFRATFLQRYQVER